MKKFSGGITQNTSGGEIGVQMAEGGIVLAVFRWNISLR